MVMVRWGAVHPKTSKNVKMPTKLLSHQERAHNQGVFLQVKVIKDYGRDKALTPTRAIHFPGQFDYAEGRGFTKRGQNHYEARIGPTHAEGNPLIIKFMISQSFSQSLSKDYILLTLSLEKGVIWLTINST